MGSMRSKIKAWYRKTYPTDELGKKISETATFAGLNGCVIMGADVYRYLGVGDSLVRQNCFSELAKRRGVSYGTIHEEWMAKGN